MLLVLPIVAINVIVSGQIKTRIHIMGNLLKNMKLISLLLSFLITFNAYANEVDDWLNKGYKAIKVKDDKQAFKWFIKAAEQGHSTAQHYISIMYSVGTGVTQDDKQAVKWQIKAAEQGNSAAQYYLGNMYTNGKGVTQDYKKAAKWYTKSAEQGYSKAQFNLGNVYSKGAGVTQDDKQAVKWYTKAAEQGDIYAQYNLALMYSNGKGVMQNNKKSYIWNAIAAASGYENAVINRDLDAKILSPRGLEEAQEEAAKIYEHINSNK